MPTRVVPGSGAILQPSFNEYYGISSINVINGGSGYASTDPPLITIEGTNPPLVEGVFYPVINPSGEIVRVVVLESGSGYVPTQVQFGTKIGIATTSYVESSLIVQKGLDTGNPYVSVASTESSIIMAISGGDGSALYENGYNIAISTSIVGTSASIAPDFSLNQNRFYGFTDPFPAYYTSGIGTGAKFNVFIVYDSSTGIPISTSVVLREGGNSYSVGDTVSISGTFMNGTSPQNDLSFLVSSVANTRVVSAANSIFNNIPSTTIIGFGTGARFNISRNSFGDISTISIANGGIGYALTDKISIAGTYIGGSTPQDNFLLSPRILGTDKLPNEVYVIKLSDNSYKVSGLSTSNELNLIQYGSGTNTFTFDNPNASSIISIDNIIQSSLYIKDISLELSSSIGVNTDIIFISSGISSVTTLDIFKINDELMKVKNIGFGYTNAIQVERSVLGSRIGVHFSGEKIDVLRGDFNIEKDNIHFASPPYGPSGYEGIQINSTFQGRAFSRQYDPGLLNDKNVIFDDISSSFVSASSTEFFLKSNKEKVVGIYTDTNSIIVGGIDINNNPLILINNVPQISEKDFTVDTPGNNRLKFLSGTPSAGKISRVGISSGYGYQPLIGAGASVTVSAAGTISNIILLGPGSGYRTPPQIKLASPVGSGASFSATIGAGGTITGISIINAGSGYTNTFTPNVIVDIPSSYSDLPLVYASGSSGNGSGAKASLVIGNQSNVIGFKLEEPGKYYKVGDILTVSGIVTNPTIGIGFSQFKITVENTITDKFSGFYPGQFIQFDDISRFFTGTKKKFTLTITQGAITEVLSLKIDPSTDLQLENNLFIYLNDILQEPTVSYTFTGSRLVFKEAPKKDSKCTILFYKGSDLDIEQIDPPKTIKPGDTIQITENILDLEDRSQFERVVKRIVSSDSLDTFTYDSIGINTDQTKERPLVWIKQTSDLIINGVLYSKSRPDLSSKIIPSTKLIKNVSEDDSQFYVTNSFPLFTEVDNLIEELRDVQIVDNRVISTGLATAVISAGSTINGVTINNPGSGYLNISSPTVAISSSFIKKKDPIYNWKTVNSGIGSSYIIKSIANANPIVAVGSSGIVGVSTNGTDWIPSFIGVGQSSTFNSVYGYNNKYVAVGNNGRIVFADGQTGITTSTWQNIRAYKEETVVGLTDPVISFSIYTNSLKDVLYSEQKNIWVAVGENRGVFSGVGIGTTAFFEKSPPILGNLNSVATNNILTSFISSFLLVVVGDSGNIIYSLDGNIWSKANSIPTTRNLNKIIWDSNRFVVVGNTGTVLTSVNGITGWQKITTNITDDLINIQYKYGFYTALNSSGQLLFSFDLSHWTKRSTNQNNAITDFMVIDPNEYILEGRFVVVGFGGTIMYSDPIYNRATAISSVNSGSISSISITNPGFGYDQQSPPPVILESDTAKTEKIFSVKAKGDFGVIKYIGVGASHIDFELKSENYDNITLGIGYSSLNTYGVSYSELEVGDYFVIYESNSLIGHALTGITTSLGGLSNYPASKVGTATTYLDGVYRVERVSQPVAGIVTVRCNFTYGPNNIPIQVNVNTNENGIYGKYSWGKIFDYQNRTRLNPKSFVVNTDNGLIGLSTAPDVLRTRGVI
jgi:hypothetical protein